MEFTLLWAALLGVGGLVLSTQIGQRTGRIPPDLHLADRLIGAAAVGMLAGRLTAMIAQGTNPFTNPADIVVVRGGVDTVTASIAALVSLGWSLRRDLWRSLDAAAPPVLAGLAGWHAGCLFRAACLGTPSDLPWSMTLPGSTVGRHPTELYAAVLLAAGAVIAHRLLAKPPPPGVLAAGGLAVAAGVRLVTQPLRPSLGNALVWWYAVGVVAGLAILLWRRGLPARS